MPDNGKLRFDETQTSYNAISKPNAIIRAGDQMRSVACLIALSLAGCSKMPCSNDKLLSVRIGNTVLNVPGAFNPFPYHYGKYDRLEDADMRRVTEHERIAGATLQRCQMADQVPLAVDQLDTIDWSRFNLPTSGGGLGTISKTPGIERVSFSNKLNSDRERQSFIDRKGNTVFPLTFLKRSTIKAQETLTYMDMTGRSYDAVCATGHWDGSLNHYGNCLIRTFHNGLIIDSIIYTNLDREMQLADFLKEEDVEISTWTHRSGL